MFVKQCSECFLHISLDNLEDFAYGHDCEVSVINGEEQNDSNN